MNDSISNIEWFRASTAYINAHRDKIFVVSLSGEAMADKNFTNIVHDLSLLHSLGVKLVLVHGARPQISSALEKSGRPSSFHRNLRITETENIEIVKQVVGACSVDLESKFSMGMSNSPMHGADIHLCRGNFVTAKPVGVLDGVDFQYTGKVRKIKAQAIQQQLEQGFIVLLSNLGYSLTGEVFNLSAEEVATETAISLGADKLIMLIPEEGIVDEKKNLVASLNSEDAQRYADQYAQQNTAEAACISHALQACVKAYDNHVHRSHLISYRGNGALLQELFTREGSGSLISNDNFDQLRDATIDDVAGILSLIEPLEEDGTLVVRSRELLETEIGNFKVIELEDTVVACAALYPTTEKFGEIACIAIHPEYQKNGYGDRLLASLEAIASGKGLENLFVLTTVTAHWFLEKGFTETKLEALPEQRQQMYNFQRNSKVLLKKL